ncbi:hypothetical protein [Burkholderia paludis]|uniref:hypothetical protein n=1 Tax=Burkholderia paludis TaxID=1506587 RepID=UPI001269C5F8|nr:hypothetical protein [Burkholderia paludis]
MSNSDIVRLYRACTRRPGARHHECVDREAGGTAAQADWREQALQALQAARDKLRQADRQAGRPAKRQTDETTKRRNDETTKRRNGREPRAFGDRLLVQGT